MKIFKSTAIFALLLLASSIAYGQARSSIGLGLGVNHWLNNNDSYNTTHLGISIMGNIRVSNKVGIEPSIGAKDVADFVNFRLNGKYFFTNRFFVTAGPFIWLGGDVESGIGGSGGVGFRLISAKTSNLEASLRNDVFDYQNHTRTNIGFRLIYNFNFRAL